MRHRRRAPSGTIGGVGGFDDRSDLVPGGRGSLVPKGGDQLTEEAECQELSADHDQDRAEEEQRSLSDRAPTDLEDREVERYRDADEDQEEADAAEQMHRSLAVAADEQHRHQVE